MRNLFAGTVLLVSCALLAGCGGSSRLSPSEYRDQLATLGKDATKAQTEVQRALSAKTVAEIKTRLSGFASAEDRLGDKVAGLKPPKNAEATNAKLSRGLHDLADEVRAVLPGLSKLTSTKAVFSLLDKSLGNAAGGREVDQALTELKKLGYAKGS